MTVPTSEFEVSIPLDYEMSAELALELLRALVRHREHDNVAGDSPNFMDVARLVDPFGKGP